MDKRILKRICKNKTSLAGLILVGFFALIALLAPALAPAENKNNPYQLQPAIKLNRKPPARSTG